MKMIQKVLFSSFYNIDVSIIKIKMFPWKDAQDFHYSKIFIWRYFKSKMEVSKLRFKKEMIYMS